jgi:hypothetical protein
MKHQNKEIYLLLVGTWPSGGLVYKVLEPTNIFYDLFLGLGIFFATCTLPKTQKYL